MQVSRRNWLIIAGIGFILVIIPVIGMPIFYNTPAYFRFMWIGTTGLILWGLAAYKYRQKVREQKNKQISSKA